MTASKNKSKVVIVDVDEVLLRWTEGLSDFLCKYWGIETKGTPTSWEVKYWIGCSEQTALEFIRCFNEESDEFGELKPIQGAVEAIQELREAGYEIYCVTASCTGTEGKRSRVFNLLELFGNVFEDIYFVPLKGCKEEVLSKFPKGSYYIEDNMINIVKGASLGLKTVQFVRPHNEKYCHSEAPRFDSWVDVVAFIKGDE